MCYVLLILIIKCLDNAIFFLRSLFVINVRVGIEEKITPAITLIRPFTTCIDVLYIDCRPTPNNYFIEHYLPEPLVGVRQETTTTRIMYSNYFSTADITAYFFEDNYVVLYNFDRNWLDRLAVVVQKCGEVVFNVKIGENKLVSCGGSYGPPFASRYNEFLDWTIHCARPPIRYVCVPDSMPAVDPSVNVSRTEPREVKPPPMPRIRPPRLTKKEPKTHHR